MELRSEVNRPTHQRSWLIVLCLVTNLIVASSAAAQSTAVSIPDRSVLSVVQDDDSAVREPMERGFLVVNLPTAPGSASFEGNVRLPHRFPGNARSGTLGQQRIGSRDSVRNGAIIGAVIGAVGFGAFAAALCRAYQEEGGRSCVPDTLRFAAIGGAIGTGAGLAIDAARRDRDITIRLAIRF